METMPIDHLDDWEQRLARQDAFWHGEVIDRPVVAFGYARAQPRVEYPPLPEYPDMRARWFDGEYKAQVARAHALNTVHGGDALPTAFPNLGPEIFSAFFGTELEYGETTSWSIPNLKDWAQVDELQFREDNAYYRAIEEMTDTYLAIGRGVFYTGITDLHPGGDAIAAFRDPLEFNIDMIEHPEEVKALLRRVTDVYFQVYDHYYDKLTAAGQAISSWPGMVSRKKWYVPSNDFSCMISKEMFDEIFLPGIAEECRHMEANVYHLDGPDALKHLDSLLSIPELNAIQWVYGAGNGRASDWVEVYQKCQAAGKGLEIYLDVDELDLMMRELRPEGLWLGLRGIGDDETAAAVLKRLTTWT